MNKFLKIVLIALFFIPISASAHIPNQSYVYLRIYENDGIEGRFEISVNEINKVFGLNLDKKVTLEELKSYIKDIQAYLLKNTSFSSVYGNHKIILKDVELLHVGLGDFLLVNFDLENTNILPDNMNMTYSAVFEKDDTHKGFLIIEYNWKAGIINNEANILLDFGPGDTEDTFSLTDVSVWKGFVAMVKQGIWHIWIGIDHILFLLALILPSVVRRRKDVASLKSSIFSRGLLAWEPVTKFKPAFFYILKVITFFTIAHTITLSLASLNIISLPSQLVEAIIALSIGLAAYHNISPIFKGKDWVIAFVFGLFHGFGFASVLSDLGLTNEYLTLSLLGFNIGVEIGQLLIIAMIFPILYLFRNKKFYNMVLVYGSVILIIISLYWGLERILDVELGVYRSVKRFVRDILISLGLWS